MNLFFFFQAEDGIRDKLVTGVQTCALPILRAKLVSLNSRVDVDTLERHTKPTSLAMNDIAHVALALAQPLFVDSYELNRATGSFILIDEASNQTVAAGMIDG